MPPGVAHQAQPMLKSLIPRARHARKHVYSVLRADSTSNGTGRWMCRNGTCPRGQLPGCIFAGSWTTRDPVPKDRWFGPGAGASKDSNRDAFGAAAY
jgi:hypothetical protein